MWDHRRSKGSGTRRARRGINLLAVAGLSAGLITAAHATPANASTPVTPSGELTASDPAADDWFGFDVAVSGDTAVVGAQRDDDAGPDSGSAYVYVPVGDTWTQQAKLTAADAAAGDRLGISVAVDGDTIVVGALGDSDDGPSSGAAYVFTRTGTTWTQQAKLTASDAAPFDLFGNEVAVSGDSVVIGAVYDDDGGTTSGSAYVFTRTGITWSEQAKLTASDADPNDNFGASVDISGDSIVAGAWRNDGHGSAYVFTRSGTTWTEQAVLTASDAAADDYFGNSVAISGDTAIAGAHGNDDAGWISGSAYVFTRSGSTWSEQAKLTASDADVNDYFGYSVAIDGDTAVVSAHNEGDGVDRYGSAYRFDRAGTIWTESAKLTVTDAAVGDNVGHAVAVSGAAIVIGAPYRHHSGLTDAGAAYVFADTSVNETAKLTAPDAAWHDFFGYSVAMSGDTAVVGARFDDDVGSGSGSAYVFERSGGVWTEQAKLTASDGAPRDYLGYAVAVSGETAVAGAYGHDGAAADSGSAYVFARSGGVWTEQARLTAADAAAYDFFGVSVAVSGDTAIVGAYQDDDAGPYAGSAYVFARSGGVWTEQAKLTASDAAAYDYFGVSVAVSGETAVVGAYQDDDAGTESGSAYVFTRSGGVWTEQAKLTASDARAASRFGFSAAMSGDTVLVGAYRDAEGSAYVFTRSGGVWTEQAKLTASDSTPYHNLGYSVAVSGDAAVVGAHGERAPGPATGSAYVFTRSGGVWTEQAKLTASDAASHKYFGISVAVSGDTAVVGAYGDDHAGQSSGAAYVFEAVIVIDADSDGYDSVVDCNDLDPDINPGALDVFNGIDDDCDGVIDNGFTDEDGDGYALEIDDCDDELSFVYPGAPELLNGIDDDCDGQTDEGFDSTPPVITAIVSGTLGDNGWYTDDVTVTWEVADPESAVTSTTGCDATNVDTDTAGDVVTCEATSLGGTASESVTVMRDATPPSATATASPPPNGNGWNNGAVTVHFAGTDALSGIAACDADVVLAGDGADQSAVGVCTDVAGNTSPPAIVAGIDIDRTPPLPVHGGPYTVVEGDSVSLDGTASSDGLSGVASTAWAVDGDGVFDDGDPFLYDGADDVVVPLQLQVIDLAGNPAVAATQVTVVNAVPAVAIGSVVNQAGDEIGVDVDVAVIGTPLTVSGSYNDAGPFDTHTATIDWGDTGVDDLGTVVGSAVATHTYATPGIYDIVLTVTDDDLGVGQAAVQVELVDAAEAVESVVDEIADSGVDDAVDALAGNNGGAGSNGAIDKIEAGNGNAGLVKIGHAIKKIEAAEAADPDLDLSAEKALLVQTAKAVALDSIEAADAATSGPAADAIIAEAYGLIAAGDDLLAAGDHLGAVASYRLALQLAETLL